jgi:hypothetical protein
MTILPGLFLVMVVVLMLVFVSTKSWERVEIPGVSDGKSLFGGASPPEQPVIFEAKINIS